MGSEMCIRDRFRSTCAQRTNRTIGFRAAQREIHQRPNEFNFAGEDAILIRTQTHLDSITQFDSAERRLIEVTFEPKSTRKQHAGPAGILIVFAVMNQNAFDNSVCRCVRLVIFKLFESIGQRQLCFFDGRFANVDAVDSARIGGVERQSQFA